MAGDITLIEPGRDVSVTLEADGSGNAPEYGDVVGIVGESSRGTHVSYPAAAGEGIGHVMTFPNDHQPTDSFDANEVIGEATIKLRSAVDWYKVADAYAGAAGDLVVSDTDGTVRAYDNAGGDTVDMVEGRVFTTLQRAEGTADKVGVLRD